MTRSQSTPASSQIVFLEGRVAELETENYSMLNLLSFIRAATGDVEGKLMQDELVEHIAREHGAVTEWACYACNTVAPAPTGLGFTCPTCHNGILKPSTLTERKLRKELADLRQDQAENDALRNRLADILTRTANALKGKPAELQSHSWHDLPEIADGIVHARDVLHDSYVNHLAEVASLRQTIEKATKSWPAINLKTGNEYEVIGEAFNATNVPVVPAEHVVIYRRNGIVFVREAKEFQNKFKAKEPAC